MKGCQHAYMSTCMPGKKLPVGPACKHHSSHTIVKQAHACSEYLVGVEFEAVRLNEV